MFGLQLVGFVYWSCIMANGNFQQHIDYQNERLRRYEETTSKMVERR